MRSLGHDAAIDGEHAPGGSERPIEGAIDCRPGDVLRRAQPPEGVPSLEGGTHGGIARPRCRERRLNDGRGDAVTPDPVLCIMTGDRRRQHEDARLGNGVGVYGEAEDRLQPQHRGDVYAGTPSLSDHGWNDGTREPEHPAETHVHGLIPRLVGHVV